MFHRKKIVILYLLPGLIGLMVFYLVPFGWGIYYSLTDGSFFNNFVWFDNYKSVIQNPAFQLGLKNTMIYSVMCAPLIWVLSFIIATMLRTLKSGNTFFRNVLLLPYLMPSAAMLTIWLVFFDYGGMVNRVVEALGFERVFWLDGAPLRVPIVLLYVWKNLGFSVVIFAAALQSVPEAYYEFANLEGANVFQRELKITLPLITPTAFLVFVLAWVNTFKIFKEIYVIAGSYPGNEVYTLQTYMNNVYRSLNYQNVTTAAYIFALIVFALFALMYASKAVRSPNQL